MRAIPVLVITSLSCLLAAAPRFVTAEPSGKNNDQRIAQLETGVNAAEAIRAVKRLQHTYGHYLESGLWDDAADLFTSKAIGEFPNETINGKSKLRKHFMRDAGRKSAGLATGQLNVHLTLQPIITLGSDGKTAKATWHEMALLGEFGKSASWKGGIYENEYVLEKGTWKISRLRYFPQYEGGYDDWGHKAPAKWAIPYHFEAAHVGVTIPQELLSTPAADSIKAGKANASGAEASTNLARLISRLQRLDDETTIRNLQHGYGYYLDRKRWDDVTDLFADDGSLELANRGAYVGREHIRRALEAIYGPSPLREGELFDHINLATVVTLAADGLSASARTTQLSMLGVNGEYAQWEEGTYENSFVKDSGVWKVKAIRYYPRMSTHYDMGWMREGLAAPVAVPSMPPDRATSPVFASYPTVDYVGFHYLNPATNKPVGYPARTVVRVPLVTTQRDGWKSDAVAAASTTTTTAEIPPEKLSSAVDTAERALNNVIAVDAVENLNSSYGYYIDESAWDNMADTYAKDGSKEITGAGVYVGPDRIRKVLNLRGPRDGRNPRFFTIHQLTQPVIHISADGAHANGRFRLFQAGGNADGSSGSWIGGIYENTAVKENGEWKFGRQELYHIFNASYRNGWARVGTVTTMKSSSGPLADQRSVRGGGITQGLGGALSAPRFVNEFPPDRPIRVRQYAFPEIVEPPFHYKNPVTARMPPELVP